MNTTIRRGISILYALFVVGFVTAQNDTLNIENETGDSLRVVVPKQALADLNMIVPPEGFVVSEAFNGYIHYQISTAIIMTMIENANYLVIDKGMTDKFFSEKQMTLIEKKPIVTDNNTKGISYKSSFVLDSMKFIRYIVYAGDLNKTLWLNITYPEKFEELVEGEILKSIQSITLNPARDEE